MRLFGGMGISIGLGVMVNEYCVVGLEFKWNFTSALFVVGNDNIRFSSVQLRSGPFFASTIYIYHKYLPAVLLVQHIRSYSNPNPDTIGC